MKELERLESRIAKIVTTDALLEIKVSFADLQAVCSALRERLEAACPGAYPVANAKRFADDKKLIERIDKFGKNLNDIEQGILETSLSFVADGRELTDKMRAVMRRVDDTKVG